MLRAIIASLTTLVAAHGAGLPTPEIPPRTPSASVDLMNDDATALVGQWRYHDAHIVQTAFREAGADRKPTGRPNVTHDIHPRPSGPDFDTVAWTPIDASTLDQRRSSGRLCAGWYRLHVTMPDSLAGFDTTGSVAVLEITADDYAEVWINGALPVVLGSSGGPLANGWNAPMRVVVSDHVMPGETFDIAVFVANGPLSDPPQNYVWMRSASLDFYAPERLTRTATTPLDVLRLDPEIDSIIPPGAMIEQLATGFTFTEGPVWVPSRFAGIGAAPIAQGHLLFSDPNDNVIYRYAPDNPLRPLSIFRVKSGYRGLDIARYRQPGSNGLALDAEGRLTICEHGNRRVTRIEHNGVVNVLADRFEGKRLNSPNDLVYRSDGALFFTDPPFGLPGFHDDPDRELPVTAVFCLIDDALRPVATDLTGPNGLAFSPDERHLYVANWDEQRKVVMRYDAASDGSLSHPTVFADLGDVPGEEALDGLKVDAEGHVFVSGPGGVWVFASDGRRLGAIRTPELAANFAFGGEDGRTLYLCARSSLHRVRLSVPGAGAR